MPGSLRQFNRKGHSRASTQMPDRRLALFKLIDRFWAFHRQREPSDLHQGQKPLDQNRQEGDRAGHDDIK